MIQPLRSIHRRVFLALAIALPAVLVAAVAVRPKRAISIASPTSAQPVPHRDAIHWKRHHAISTIEHAPGQASTIHFASYNKIDEPDVLVYWSPIEPRAQSLPSDAVFLGTLQQLNVSASLDSSGGFLVLYSLPHATVVDTAALGDQP